VRSNFANIPESFPLLAERLRLAGYRTAAFVENPALRESKGFSRGFDVYEVVLAGRKGSSRVLDAYFRWAAGTWDRPTFVWIHLLDPHGPYRPTSDYEQLFIGDEWAVSEERVPLAEGKGLEVLKVLGKVPRYQQRGREDRVARFVARYDAEIRMVDDSFGRVLDDLRERGLFDEVAVVFTSDHGESLGEHDYYFEHGWFAYEPGLRVPLLVKTPGQRAGERVTAPVSNLDLFRTLAGIARADVPDGVRGRDLLTTAPGDPLVLVENSDRYPDKYFGLRGASEKYLRREGDGREELYDLASDPGETRNLAALRPERTRELRERLDRRLAELGHVALPPVEPGDDDAATLERLKELGYVQ
jgi:arylsulfatase A-like enzyme